ncbi:MAG: SNF2-related protein [Pirellulaceae bacterium]
MLLSRGLLRHALSPLRFNEFKCKRPEGKHSGASSQNKRTRIAPPADLVKLEDRLYFVLQPPLEALMSSAQLTFPFDPFPYQMEGIAFLFPRETAILADEMGLGKTMQAITTIRMLLLAGQLQLYSWSAPNRWSPIGSANSGSGHRKSP